MSLENFKNQAAEENEGLKKFFLVVFFVASITVTIMVAIGEVNVMKAFAITEWEKMFFTFVFAAIAVATPIVIPTTVVIKKTGLIRWLPVGVTLSTLLIVYEFAALDHIILKTGVDNSDVHKENSLSREAMKTALSRLSGNDAIIVDAGTDQANNVLEKSAKLADEKTALMKCPKKKAGYSCRKEHKANIAGLEIELASLANYQEHATESAAHNAEAIKMAMELKDMADNDETKIVAAPAFRMLSSDPETALSYQKIFSHFVAVVILAFNIFSMMMVGGLASSLGFTKDFTGRIKSRLHDDVDSPTLQDDDFEMNAVEMAMENQDDDLPQPESFSDRLRNNPDNLYAAFQNAPAYSGRNINTANTVTAFNPNTVFGSANTDTNTPVKPAESVSESVSESVFLAENTPVCINADTNTDTDTDTDMVNTVENTDSSYQGSKMGFMWSQPSFKATTGGVVDGVDTGKPVIRWPENKPPVFDDAEKKPEKVNLEKTVSVAEPVENTVETVSDTDDSKRDRSKMVVSYLREHKKDFFADKKRLSIRSVNEFIRGNGMSINQNESTKAVKILLDEGFPQTRQEFNREAGE